jgi:hypothetical protein
MGLCYAGSQRSSTHDGRVELGLKFVAFSDTFWIIPSPVCSLEALARADDQLKAAPGDYLSVWSIMLEALELQELARRIVHNRVPSVHLDDVLTENFTSSDGEDALRITLVLTPESVDAISGEDALKLLVDIRNGLVGAGEERFPIVEYATPEDLAEEADQAD